MTITYNPTSVANLVNPTTGAVQINSNFTAISSAFQQAFNATGDTLSGTLNANSQQIINLPPPSTSNSPARLVDVTSSTQGSVIAANITGVGANSILGNLTGSPANATSIAVTGTNSVVMNSSPTIQSPTMSSANLLGPTNFNSGVVTNLNNIQGNTVSSAAAGAVGEYQISPSITILSPANSTNIAVNSLTLTPGDWEVGLVYTVLLATGAIQNHAVGVGPNNGSFTGAFGDGLFRSVNVASAGTGLISIQDCMQGGRIFITSTQQFFLNIYANAGPAGGVGATNLQVGGQLWARRMH